MCINRGVDKEDVIHMYSGILCVCAKLLQLCEGFFVTLWTVACQAPLSMGFSGQEYWSELPCPSPGDLPDTGIKLQSLTFPELAGRFFTSSTTWEEKERSNAICSNMDGRGYDHTE